MMSLNSFLRVTTTTLGLITGCLSAASHAQAASWCAPVKIHAKSGLLVTAIADVAVAQQRLYVERDVVESGLYLLGINGLRIEVGQNLMPSPRLIDGRLQVPQPWSEGVDWPVYHRPALALQPSPTLVFETDNKGDRHLCRIEKRDLSKAFWERANAKLSEDQRYTLESRSKDDPLPDWLEPRQAEDVELSELEQLLYDEQGRVLGYETLRRDDDSGRWTAGDAKCFAYDPKGFLLAVISPASSRCGDVQPSDTVDRYVNGADGRLLRSIQSAARMEMQKGGYAFVAHPMVLVYDSAGVVKARYQEDAQLHRYRLAEAPVLSQGSQINVAVIDSVASLGKLVIRDPYLAPSMDWKIAALPKDAKGIFEHLYALTPWLAQGKIGKYGRVNLTADEQQKIWRAMHQDDQLVVLHGSDPVVLAPRVSSAQWQACINQGGITAEACP